jgi:long-chain fatty acid transport protein
VKRTIAVIAALLPTTALAAGFSTVDRGVVALGSGGTGTARASDPAANVYNPAAATTDRGFLVSAGMVLAFPSVTAKSDGWEQPSDKDLVTPPMLHVRFSNGDYAAGASLTVPFGSSVNWPVSWPGRFELTKAKLTDLRISAFGGAKVGDFAFAVEPFLDLASLRIERMLDFVEEEGTTALDMSGRGFGVTLAAFYRPIDPLSLGLTYQSRSKIDFEGYADFEVPPEFTGRAQDGKVRTSIKLPDRITFGALYQATEELDVALDLELVLWSTVDRLALDFESDATPDTIQARNWHTTIAPRIGGSYAPAALDWLTVRAGLFLDPSPVPKDTVGPSSPDSTRFGVALGAGAELIGGFTLDAGYQLIVLTGAKSEAESATLRDVSYSGLVQLFGLSASYRL